MTHVNTRTFRLDAATERLISSYPKLAPAAEQHLTHDGSDEARDQLIGTNLRLVKSIVFKFRGCGLEAADLFSAGVTGLVKASEKYIPSRGKFAAFARPYIRGEILDHINTYRTSFHIPDSLCRQVNQYRVLCQKLSTATSDTAIASELDWSVEKVQYVRECWECQQMFSLDEALEAPESDVTLGETLATDCQDLSEFEIMHDIEVYLAQVSDLEAEVLRLRWGIGVAAPMSVRAVAKLLGMSRSSVSRTEYDAFQKLRRLARREFKTGNFY